VLLSGEAGNTIFIVFGLTFDLPMTQTNDILVYTQGEHSNNDPADCATLETPKIFVKCKRTIAIYSLLFLPLFPYDFFFHIKITSKSLMLHTWSQQF
jgi:hypothetical protein